MHVTHSNNSKAQATKNRPNGHYANPERLLGIYKFDLFA